MPTLVDKGFYFVDSMNAVQRTIELSWLQLMAYIKDAELMQE